MTRKHNLSLVFAGLPVPAMANLDLGTRRRRTNPASAAELVGQVIEVRDRPGLGKSTNVRQSALLAITLIVAYSVLVVVLLIGPGYFGFALPSLLLLSVAVVRRPRRGDPRGWFTMAIIVPQLLLVGTLAVCAATRCLYYTYGGVGAMAAIGLFFLTLLAAGIPCWWRCYRLAVAFSILVTVGFAAEQAVLSIRLQHLYDEAERIMDWSEASKQSSGVYPDSLESYPWARPELREYISYFDSHNIVFHPIPNIGVQHGFSAGRGWYFNDD